MGWIPAWFLDWLGKTKLPVEPLPDKPKPMPPVKDKYKNVTFEGATFPDDPYKAVTVKLNDTIKNEYLPALAKLEVPKGLKLLITAMTHVEGFRPGTRSYRYNNPGNVGNTDSGANKGFKTLADGIRAQAIFIQDIAHGMKKAYPLGKPYTIPPFYSKEIANNPITYAGMQAYSPGYKFNPYSGQLDQFVKIYSTGSRTSNSYLNTIVSYFKQNGLEISADSKLQDIIGMG